MPHRTEFRCSATRPHQLVRRAANANGLCRNRCSRQSLIAVILRLFSAVLLMTLAPLAQAGTSLELLPQVAVDTQGVFLDQLFTQSGGDNKPGIPHVQISPAPAWAENQTLSRKQVAEAVMKFASDLGEATLTGAPEVRITRRSRQLEEKELTKLLLEKLQPASRSERQEELEIRLIQWRPVLVPVEPIDLRIVSQPASGISARFSVRFELRSGEESVGVFTGFVEAHLFREVWVTRSAIKRGTPLDAADLAQERRDVLANLRDPPWSGQEIAPHFQAMYDIPAGAVLPARAVKSRPVIQRGHYAQAVANDGLLTVSTKVEALEDGAPGDTIRARNPRTKKEIRGKVIDEDTIQIVF